MFVVVKLPGAGRIVHCGSKAVLPWMEYRKYQIDDEFFNDAIDSLIQLSFISRVGLVSGGIGAYLYIGLAKSLGLNDCFLSSVGIDIVNLLHGILLKVFLEKGANICPYLVSIESYNYEHYAQYDLLIFSATNNVASTDSLAVMVAEICRADTLLLFKENVPCYHVGFDEPTSIDAIHVDQLIQKANKFSCSPGDHFILDRESLALIKKNKLNTFLVNPHDILQIKNIIRGVSTASVTKIHIG